MAKEKQKKIIIKRGSGEGKSITIKSNESIGKAINGRFAAELTPKTKPPEKKSK